MGIGIIFLQNINKRHSMNITYHWNNIIKTLSHNQKDSVVNCSNFSQNWSIVRMIYFYLENSALSVDIWHTKHDDCTPEVVIWKIGPWAVLTLLRAEFFRGNIKHIFPIHVIPPHCYNTGAWNPSSNKTRNYPFYRVNIMAAGVLAKQGASTSTAKILS